MQGVGSGLASPGKQHWRTETQGRRGRETWDNRRAFQAEVLASVRALTCLKFLENTAEATVVEARGWWEEVGREQD